MVLGVGDHCHQHEGGVTQEVEWEEYLLHLGEHMAWHRQEESQTCMGKRKAEKLVNLIVVFGLRTHEIRKK